MGTLELLETPDVAGAAARLARHYVNDTQDPFGLRHGNKSALRASIVNAIRSLAGRTSNIGFNFALRKESPQKTDLHAIKISLRTDLRWLLPKFSIPNSFNLEKLENYPLDFYTLRGLLYEFATRWSRPTRLNALDASGQHYAIADELTSALQKVKIG